MHVGHVIAGRLGGVTRLFGYLQYPGEEARYSTNIPFFLIEKTPLSNTFYGKWHPFLQSEFDESSVRRVLAA